MNVLFLEPFYGGSHKAFAEGLAARSRHRIDLFHLPARFWKWRMRGAALHFAETVKDPARYDLVIASGLMSAADFKALAKTRCPPVLVYFHENQFSYPLAEGEQMDYQFGFTDITSALAADRILFNSKTHMDAFFAHMKAFIRKMPDFRPGRASATIREKAFVCYPGCDLAPDSDNPWCAKDFYPDCTTPSPLILWNHRWEHDKNPEAFFRAVEKVAAQDIDFRIALLGEVFARYPEVFDAAKQKWRPRIAAFGFEPDNGIYRQWLQQSAIVVSTAIQENFGISVVEAAARGCLPLVPDRLSYPEIIPASFHGICLYRSETELAEKLAWMLKNIRLLDHTRARLAAEMVHRYDWQSRIAAFDRHILETASFYARKKGARNAALRAQK